jgi:hypothetical protein
LRCTNAHAQERRASARRGQGIAPAAPSVSCRMRMLAYHGGLTPPALGGSAVRTFAGETATCALHERSLTRAAGVSPPWFGIALTIPNAFRKPSRSPHPGWLTPAALGAQRSFAARCTYCNTETCGQPRAAGVSPPGYVIRPLWRESRRLLGKCRTHNRERPTSARRGSVSPSQSQTLFADRLAPRTPAGLHQPHLRQSSASGEGSHVAVGLPPPSQLFNPEGSFATAPGRVSAHLAANCVCPDGTIETQRRGRDRHDRHGHCAQLSK